MTMEPGVGRHRLPGAGGAVGMRSMSLIGAVGIFAMVLALAGWGVASLFGGSRPTDATKAAASIGSTAPNDSHSGALSTSVPNPSAATSSAAATASTSSAGQLGSSGAGTTSGAGSGTSSTTRPSESGTPSPSTSVAPTPPRTTTPPSGISDVALTCTITGRRIQAVLTFVSTTSVTAVLRAGDSTTTKVGVGAMTVTIVGSAGPTDCWAAVDGRTIGTIPAT